MRLPIPILEYRFARPRLWRFDFAWPLHMIAAECEGAVWTNGRHTRGSGFIKDIEKYNAATIMGWRVLRFDPARIQSGAAIDDLKSLFQDYGHPADNRLGQPAGEDIDGLWVKQTPSAG